MNKKTATNMAAVFLAFIDKNILGIKQVSKENTAYPSYTLTLISFPLVSVNVPTPVWIIQCSTDFLVMPLRMLESNV